MKTSTELRAEAAAAAQRSADSFERSDTDGFLSQWANDMTAQLLNRKAEIVDQGGRARFIGLYHGEQRVAARLVDGRYGWVWMLRDDEAGRYGRKFVPHAGFRKSRAQAALKLAEHREWAPAKARIGGNGTGLSGCATAYVETIRTGDAWGLDSELIKDIDGK